MIPQSHAKFGIIERIVLSDAKSSSMRYTNLESRPQAYFLVTPDSKQTVFVAHVN